MTESTPPKVSVCICAHNPNRKYFKRVLKSIAEQTLAGELWELIVVDNLSEEALEGWVDLTPFRNARLMRQPRLGLVFARMTAIEAARGEVLVFVDDDNVLDAQYLEHALRIMDEKPFLGAAGGRCLGEFERPMPAWMWRFSNYMAVADHGENPIWGHWAYSYQLWFPYGAGMVLRRELARRYLEGLNQEPDRTDYGRKGNVLSGAEDIDILYTVMDEEYAVGYFPELSLKHIIPRERTTMRYMMRLIYHAHKSAYTLQLRRGMVKRPWPWPLAYAACVVMCLIQNDWRPLTWWLAFQVARGKYAAYREFLAQQNEAQPNVEAGAGPVSAEATTE